MSAEQIISFINLHCLSEGEEKHRIEDIDYNESFLSFMDEDTMIENSSTDVLYSLLDEHKPYSMGCFTFRDADSTMKAYFTVEIDNQSSLIGYIVDEDISNVDTEHRVWLYAL